jgi:hypothetical protein
MAENERKGAGGRKKLAPPTPATIAFDYIKSNYFRVIHCEGIVGGITPGGFIHMAPWNARQPYPQQVVHELTADTKMGKEVHRTTRETDIVREIETDIVFTPEMARVIIRWLEKRLSELEEIERQIQGKRVDE